jgi:osmotically-inducible protein OsmY
MVITALPSNEIIRKKVYDQMYWDSRVDYSNINVIVSPSGDKVTLAGSVPNHQARKAAESDALQVAGINKVDNQLHIRFSDNLSIPSDRQLEEHIYNIIRWYAGIKYAEIAVSVREGKAVFEGTVPSFYQKFRIQELALDVIGVKDVENHIVVVPTLAQDDAAIGQALADAFENHLNFDTHCVTIMVKDGIVTLTGTVPDHYAYNAIETLTAHTKGVRDMHNLLQVK